MDSDKHDEKEKIFLTIESAIKAVAREFNLMPEVLEGSMSEDGSCVTITLLDSTNRFRVRTLERARQNRIKEISRSIMEDTLLDNLFEITPQEILAILWEQADLKDLVPWIVSSTRRIVRAIAKDHCSTFWNLWTEAKLKPIASLDGKNVNLVYPSFSLMKNLQDYLAMSSCSDSFKGLMDLCDGDCELACEVLLEQCHFDVEKTAAAFLQGHDRDFFNNQMTLEEFAIETD